MRNLQRAPDHQCLDSFCWGQPQSGSYGNPSPESPALLFHHLDHLLAHYGYGVVGVIIMFESMGVPLPGESLLIGTALYCAATHKLDIVWVIAVAVAGAVMGDNLGYLIGRSLGFRALARWGRHIGLTDERLTLGRYLFRRHGGKVVFFGRFIAILRTFAALLAGANRMPWLSFLVFNALGGVGWAGGYSLAAYLLGSQVEKISGPLGIAFGTAAILIVVSVFLFLKRNERRLIDEAMRAAKTGPDRIETDQGKSVRS